MMRKDNLLAVRMAAIRGDHQFESRIRGPSELGSAHEAERDRSALGSRHHLHPIEGRVCLSGGDSRCLLSESGGLGAGSNVSEPADDWQHSSRRLATTATTWSGSPFGPRTAIRSSEYVAVLENSRCCQHEPSSESVRQCELREFHEDLKREEIYANRYENLGTCERTSRNSSSSITIGSGCTRRWATVLRKNSNSKLNFWERWRAQRVQP